MNAAGPFAENQIVVLLAGAVFVGIPVILALIFLVWLDRLKSRRRDQRHEKPRPRRATQGSRSAILWILLIWGAMIVWSFQAPRAGPDGRMPPRSYSLGIAVILFPFAFVGGLLALSLVRVRDRVISQANQKAASGNLDGAIADLEEAMDHNPTANRANVLGTHYLAKKDGVKAYKSFLQAQEISQESQSLAGDVYRANASVALRLMGRASDALDLLEPCVRKETSSWFEVAHYAETLAELDRLDDAQDALERSEKLFKTQRTVFPPSFGRQQDEFIKGVRERIEKKRLVETPRDKETG